LIIILEKEEQSAPELSLREELNKILANDQECFMFRIFLKQRRCEENLYFILDLRSYKNIEETPDNLLEEKSR
jgi:hypothetical protein